MVFPSQFVLIFVERKRIKELYNIFYLRDYSNYMMWKCKVCGKIAKRKDKLGSHIESHLNGFIHKCGLCRKNFKTRNSLHIHQKYIHKKFELK